MSMRFLKAGLQTSLQDTGRIGFMHQGVSISGAMDPIAMKMANWLVSKPLDSVVLEITLIGPIVEFSCSLKIAICGAKFNLFLNGNMIFNDETIQVNKGDVLEFEQLQEGCRAYLAFSASLEIKPMLSSYSTHLTAKFGGHNNSAIKDKEQIDFSSTSSPKNKAISDKSSLHYTGHYLLRTTSSIETQRFSQQQKDNFFSQTFLISPNSNRMGIHLKGNPILFDEPTQTIFQQMASSGLIQGSIQIPPSGQIIISSVDGQTIGGYPRIANIISADLPLLGQLKAHDKVSFISIELKDAIKILEEKNTFLTKLFKISN